MASSYSIDCDYGGLGNFQEDDTACMLCPHELDCSHESELAELEAARTRRTGNSWRYPGKSSVERRGTTGGTAARFGNGAFQSSERRKSRRPMPVPGENALARGGKNVFMSALSAGFREAADFCDDHNLAPVVGGVVVPAALPAPKKKE